MSNELMQLQKLTVGSLFAGIGGFDLGLERTGGFEIKWQVEIDDYCRRVLAKHWPGVQRYGDIRTVTNVEPVNVLCGGFPCQDISNAGKRTGIDGERSGLWSEYVRLIRLVRPRYVIVENVSALLGRGMERVLGDLSACGYDAEWDCIPACAIGAPHRRDRLWIVAYANSGRTHHKRERIAGRGGASYLDRHGAIRNVADADGKRLGEFSPSHDNDRQESSRNDADGCSSAVAVSDGERPSHSSEGHARREGFTGRNAARSGRTATRDISDTGSTRLWFSEQQTIFGTRGRQEGRTITQCDWWATEPDVGRVAHGIPARVDRLKGLGNAVVPQIVEWIGNQILAYENSLIGA